MYFSLPPSAQTFRRELRSWLSAHLTEEVVTAGSLGASDPAAFEILRAWSRTMAEDRWAAVSWAPEYGGRGVGPLEQTIYVEETVGARAPLPLNIIGMNNIAPAIMRYGSPAQKATLLPRMMRTISSI